MFLSAASFEFGVLRSITNNDKRILQLVKDLDGQIEALIRNQLPYSQEVVVNRLQPIEKFETVSRVGK